MEEREASPSHRGATGREVTSGPSRTARPRPAGRGGVGGVGLMRVIIVVCTAKRPRPSPAYTRGGRGAGPHCGSDPALVTANGEWGSRTAILARKPAVSSLAPPITPDHPRSPGPVVLVTELTGSSPTRWATRGRILIRYGREACADDRVPAGTHWTSGPTEPMHSAWNEGPIARARDHGHGERNRRDPVS